MPPDTTPQNPLAQTLHDLQARGHAVEQPDRPALGFERDARYRFVRDIGEGGMGHVTEAVDEAFGRRVAVKELLPDARTHEWRARFSQEAIVTANLEHPGVPSVYDRGLRDDDAPFYVMQLVEGRPLSDAIAACETMQDRLALLPAVISASQTLAFAHERGVIHRDVKPQNIVLGRHGQTVVVDWGIAKVRDVADRPAVSEALSRAVTDSSATVHGAVFGTLGYMAPEQALGRLDEIDERTDVFALGALLYHLLAGRAPYDVGNVREALERAKRGAPPPLVALARAAPRRLRDIVGKAMAPAREDRYASATELARALEAFTAEALSGAPSRAVEHLALGVSVVTVTSLTALLAFVFHVLSFHALGPASSFYTAFGIAGAVLSVVELRTRGRYSLSSLALVLAIVTLLGGLAYTAAGLMVCLRAVSRPEIVADALRWRQIVGGGAHESLGNTVWAATLTALQLGLWGVARRGVERSTRMRTEA